jgi:hypothetical protein
VRKEDRDELIARREMAAQIRTHGEFLGASILLKGIVEWAPCGAFVPDPAGRPSIRTSVAIRGMCPNCGLLVSSDLALRCPRRTSKIGTRSAARS